MVIFLRIVAMERMKLVVVDAEMINSNARLPINVFHSLPFVTQRRYIQLAHSSYIRSVQEPVIEAAVHFLRIVAMEQTKAIAVRWVSKHIS